MWLWRDSGRSKNHNILHKFFHMHTQSDGRNVTLEFALTHNKTNKTKNEFHSIIQFQTQTEKKNCSTWTAQNQTEPNISIENECNQLFWLCTENVILFIVKVDEINKQMSKNTLNEIVKNGAPVHTSNETISKRGNSSNVVVISLLSQHTTAINHRSPRVLPKLSSSFYWRQLVLEAANTNGFWKFRTHLEWPHDRRRSHLNN